MMAIGLVLPCRVKIVSFLSLTSEDVLLYAFGHDC